MLVVCEAAPLRSSLRAHFPCLATRRGEIQLLTTKTLFPTQCHLGERWKGTHSTRHSLESNRPRPASFLALPSMGGASGGWRLRFTWQRYWTELASVLNQEGGSHGHSLDVPHGIVPTVSHSLLVQFFLQGQLSGPIPETRDLWSLKAPTPHF